jgi:hypothetical protein
VRPTQSDDMVQQVAGSPWRHVSRVAPPARIVPDCMNLAGWPNELVYRGRVAALVSAVSPRSAAAEQERTCTSCPAGNGQACAWFPDRSCRSAALQAAAIRTAPSLPAAWFKKTN